MGRLWLLLLLLVTPACTAQPWAWQDVRIPPRPSSEADLAACRSYASAQYAPGMPMGDPYLEDHPLAPSRDDAPHDLEPGAGTWHPDREPFPDSNRYQEPNHGVIVPYTGYPGYLDYHPEYLDALVERCMADRGWAYRPAVAVTKK